MWMLPLYLHSNWKPIDDDDDVDDDDDDDELHKKQNSGQKVWNKVSKILGHLPYSV